MTPVEEPAPGLYVYTPTDVAAAEDLSGWNFPEWQGFVSTLVDGNRVRIMGPAFQIDVLALANPVSMGTDVMEVLQAIALDGNLPPWWYKQKKRKR